MGIRLQLTDKHARVRVALPLLRPFVLLGPHPLWVRVALGHLLGQFLLLLVEHVHEGWAGHIGALQEVTVRLLQPVSLLTVLLVVKLHLTTGGQQGLVVELARVTHQRTNRVVNSVARA